MSQGAGDGPAFQMVGDAAMACGPDGCELPAVDAHGNGDREVVGVHGADDSTPEAGAGRRSTRPGPESAPDQRR